jgi:penicillin-insensitive murein endopeptidase
VEFIEELSKRAAQNGWPGLLIGDMSQPRGGPMFNRVIRSVSMPISG